MKLSEAIKILNAKVVCGEEKLDSEIGYAFASDLMSDVLTLDTNNLLLITGLANLQTIRTAEMSDIQFIIFCRNKKVNEEMLVLADENQLVVLECAYSMFKTCGLLFQHGIQPLY
ncbi:MAG: DRTGG domain-containing protein [Lentimicrobiaceae bacterium]|nr:DRTGG domain-containing protein [Lentimicrobiaceae bacterium]